MTIERHPIVDRASWLEMRKRDVTASVVAALFGAHPYETALGLWAEKSGVEMPDTDKLDDVVLRGLIYEPVVAAMARIKKPDWTITPANEYVRDPEARIGASPDFYIDGDPRGRGVLQVKTVAPRTFKERWLDGIPPFWIMLQTLTETMVTDYSFGVVAAWIIDPYKRPDVEFFPIPRHAGTEKRIRGAVSKFWQATDAGEQPNPDYARDAALIAQLYPEPVPAKTIDLTGDNQLPVLLAERAEIKKRIGKDEARCEQIETEFKHKMGAAEIATLRDWQLTWKLQHRKSFVVKATSMRVLRVTDQRTEEVDDDKPF